jgi:nicotinate-nucleotide pyrophosphorylase (carboxylating)
MNCPNTVNSKLLSRPYLEQLVRQALREDIGKKDITTELIIPANKVAKAVLLAKQDCIVCGIDIAGLVFKAFDRRIRFKAEVRDGQQVKKGKILGRIVGRARPILSAERVALNFLGLLCGIATKTKEYVDTVRPYRVMIMDTRKTIPGLRLLQKYAVRVGGGYNHRMRLDEMILIKDNHIASCVLRHAFCVNKTLEMLKKKNAQNVKVEIEVNNIRDFKEALKVSPDIIMLDNMSLGQMRKAVLLRRKTQNVQHKTQDARHKTQLEASGGITLKNIREVASAGVDMISVGALTHSISSCDISLEIEAA